MGIRGWSNASLEELLAEGKNNLANLDIELLEKKIGSQLDRYKDKLLELDKVYEELELREEDEGNAFTVTGTNYELFGRERG